MNIEKGVPITFKVEEVAKILNCSRSQVYVLMKTGELASAQIRGSRRVTENQLVQYIRKIEKQILGSQAKLFQTLMPRTENLGANAYTNL